MRFYRYILLATCAVLNFTACTSHTVKARETAKIYYSDARFAGLILPSEAGVLLEENQQMAGTYGEKQFSGNSWMLLNDSLIHMMLFSSMGNTIAELVYTEDSIGFHSKWMDAEKVKPEYVVADIQFCYYPAPVLQKNFERAGFAFAESQNDSILVRTLSDGKTPILKMEKSGNRIHLENLLRHYSYQIESEAVK